MTRPGGPQRPKLPWVMRMNWRDLLFLHWPVPAHALQSRLPEGVILDRFAGEAWLGVLPFAVTDFRPRGLPLSLAYGQVNVRTYVLVNGVPGIWTFSLDAAHALTVRAARAVYCLPYFDAAIKLSSTSGWTQFESARLRAPVGCRLQYRPVSPVFQAQPGTLEHWLTERRSLFTRGWGGQLWRADVQHEPWPLQTAEATLERCTLTEPLGIGLGGAPLAHYARVVHVRGWPPVPVGAARS